MTAQAPLRSLDASCIRHPVKGGVMKSPAVIAALGLGVLALLGTPEVSRADVYRTDYTVDFQPPTSETFDFTGFVLEGDFVLYFQPLVGIGGAVPLGQTRITGLGLNDSRSGSLTFDVDLSAGAGNLLLTFAGLLSLPNPGPPNMPFFAFPPNPIAPEYPDPGPPGINLGVLGTGYPDPGPPNMPLYAFASVHEIGSLAVTVSAVPLPETSALLSLGLGLIAWGRRRKRPTV